MTDKIFIKPNDEHPALQNGEIGLHIPDPNDPKKAIPATGAYVPNSKIYRRFVQSGEAVLTEPETATVAETAPSPEVSPESSPEPEQKPEPAATPTPAKTGKGKTGASKKATAKKPENKQA